MFYGRGTKMMNYQTCLDTHSKNLKRDMGLYFTLLLLPTRFMCELKGKSRRTRPFSLLI